MNVGSTVHQETERSHFLLLGVHSVEKYNVLCENVYEFIVISLKWLFSQMANIIQVLEFGFSLRVSLNTTCLMFL